MVYVSAVLIPGFYFDKWRALATGISVCGSGIGTFVLAPLNVILVENYGWRIAIMVQSGKSIFFIRHLPLRYVTLMYDIYCYCYCRLFIAVETYKSCSPPNVIIKIKK